MTTRYPTELVRHHFSADVRRVGAALPLGASLIQEAHRVECGVTARMALYGPVEVHALWAGPEAPGWCTCEAFADEGPCEHMWALFRWADISLDHRAEPISTAPEPLQEQRPWIARLRRLAQVPLVTTYDPWQQLTTEEQELRYQLVLPSRPRVDGDIGLAVVQRKRKKNGDWSEAKVFPAERVERDDITNPDDRRFIALLTHGSDLGTGRFYRSHVRPTGQFELSDDVAEHLLPELASLGRLDVYDRFGKVHAVPLDGGDPWRFRLAILRDEERSALRLDGELLRSGAQLPLPAVVHFVGRRLVVTPHGLGRLDVTLGQPWMFELWSGGPVVAPLADAEALTSSLRAMPLEIDGSEAGEGVVLERPRAGVPRPHIHVAPAPVRATQAARVECVVTFDYGMREAIRPDHRDLSLAMPDGSYVARDLAAEHQLLAQYFAAGGRRTATDVRDGSHGTVAAKRVPEVVRELMQLGWSVTAEGKRLVAPGAAKASVRTGVDWFEVEGGVQFGDEVVPFPTLLRAVKKGEREVALGDGRTGVLPESWLAQWGLLELADGTYGDTLTFAKNQAWLLDALLNEREEVVADAAFEASRARLANFRGIEAGAEPQGFQGVLRPYQREALGWFGFLREMGFGGCLADDMGLGKTVQVLALLESRRGEERVGPSMVVAPKSLVFNWIAEAKRFAPSLRVLDYTGTDRATRLAEAERADLLVTTYGTLRLDAAELVDVRFDYLVLDEATAIKNEASQAAKAARVLRAEHRLALSGTPVENHLGELWSLFEFLNPGMLGRSTLFRELCTRGGQASSRGKLAQALRPFFLRRTKGEVLTELPPKSEQVIHCDLSPSERERYDELRDHYRAALLDDGKTAKPGDSFMVLEALLRLRQAACHPGLLDPALAGADSAKLQELLPRLEQLASEGHKCLVFSQFTSLLAIVRQRLTKAGLCFEYLDGQTRDRKTPVERFQSDPDVKVFLISLKAGGHGLNLTASDYVFLLDPWWNPAVEAQAVDRAHRMGQTRPVIAYRLIARGTVEERVQELQAKKRELAAALFADDPGALGKVTRDDLRALLA